MPISVLASTSSVSPAGGPPVPTSAIDTTGADLFVAGVNGSSVIAQAAVADSLGNSWTKLGGQSGRGEIVMFVCIPSAVGIGHTFAANNTGSGTNGCLSILAVSGASAAPFDTQNGSHNGAGATTCSSGTVSPAIDGELIVAAWGLDDPAETGSMTVDSGFTLAVQHSTVPGSLFGGALAYLIQSSHAPVTATLTRSVANSGSGDDVGRIIAIFPAGGGPYSLLGSGVQTIVPGTQRVLADLTTIPFAPEQGQANPPNFYHVGMLRPILTSGHAGRVQPIDAEHCFVDLPADTVSIGYVLFHGYGINLTEAA